MIIPKYWSEARVQQRLKGQQITVKRLGWSNLNQEDADNKANTRAQDAIKRLFAGEKLARREPKVAYNGAEGIPIREEIVDTQDDTIITRNSYGALCINSPNVLFVDIDYYTNPRRGLWTATITSLLILSGLTAIYSQSWILFIALAIFSLFLAIVIVGLTHNIYIKLCGGEEKIAMSAIESFSQQNPEWHLRVYQTPAGLRVLVMQQTFEPRQQDVKNCFKQMRADPLYALMCHNQQCFRARVSPKPWRIDNKRLKPSLGRWPIEDHNKLTLRKQWVNQYERDARNYASCRFLKTLGNHKTTIETQTVQRLHDKLCQANSQLPLA